MPMYENPNRGTAIVEGVGDAPSMYIEYGMTFLGNQEQHDKLADIKTMNPPMIKRLTSGLVHPGVVNDSNSTLEFHIGHGIDIDNCIVREADKQAFPDLSPVNAGDRITAWGTIQWFDGDTAGSQQFFYITGDGKDDGSLCAIAFGSKEIAPDCISHANATIAAADNEDHQVECTKGALIFTYSGTDPQRASIEIIFDPLNRGLYSTMGRSRNILTSAVISYVREYVTSDDISSNPKYVGAIVGSIKSEKAFPSGSQPGDTAKITRFYYSNVNPNNAPSHEMQQIVEVLEEDLNP